MPLTYTRADGTVSEYDSTKYSKEHYAKISQVMFTCECCNKTIKEVSRKAHNKGKSHLRSQELFNQGTPAVVETADYSTDSC
jgi:hypothetical protein